MVIGSYKREMGGGGGAGGGGSLFEGKYEYFVEPCWFCSSVRQVRCELQNRDINHFITHDSTICIRNKPAHKLLVISVTLLL